MSSQLFHRLASSTLKSPYAMRIALGGSSIAAVSVASFSSSSADPSPTHRIEIGSVVRQLPIRAVKPEFKVALFNPLGDWELNEALGKELAPKTPAGTDIFLMPDGKAQALLHILGRETGITTIVARKEKKSYMKEPVVVATRDLCMTSANQEKFYLGQDDVERMKGKNVVIVDDVVSTGGSLIAMKFLVTLTNGKFHGVMCALTEGPNIEGRHDGVICLGNLPLNDPSW